MTLTVGSWTFATAHDAVSVVAPTEGSIALPLGPLAPTTEPSTPTLGRRLVASA